VAPRRVLEVAAGTGVLTRALCRTLPPSSAIVATDLNPAMLEEAAANGTSRPVEFRPADALALPFEDQTFDAVVCQFGVMFFPDKAQGLSELRRVLRPGGELLFNVWDRIETNELADAVTAGLAALFPGDPPKFLPRAPYGYFDRDTIAADIASAGFTAPALEVVSERSRSRNAFDPAVGFCQGSPLRGEIEARGDLDHATEAAAGEIRKRFGSGPIDARIQAIVVTAKR
jgi:SAM-dependent methyltransferase